MIEIREKLHTASEVAEDPNTNEIGFTNDGKTSLSEHNDSNGNNKENSQRCSVNHEIAEPDEENLNVERKSHESNAGFTKCSTETIRPRILSRSRKSLSKEISKQVLRHKLQKLRHLVIEGAISEDYLEEEIFHPKLLEMFDPQTVTYNGGVAKVKEWKISCYLEVMEGGVPCTNPHLELLNIFRPLLDTCDDLFMIWYKQQHACNRRGFKQRDSLQYKERKQTCERLMTFVTRYTPAPGEQALLKHIDGAGKVDGSCVVALPIDKWSAPEEVNSFYGHGGGLTFWDGKERVPEDETKKKNHLNRPKFRPRQIHYDTRPGDVAFIDRAVWHQADPITKGTRWALVIFYKVGDNDHIVDHRTH